MSVCYFTESESYDNIEIDAGQQQSTGTTSGQHSETAEYRQAIDRVAHDVAAFLTASCIGKVVLVHDDKHDETPYI